MIYHHADCNKEMCNYGRPQLLILLLNTKKKVAAVTTYCKWGTNASTAKIYSTSSVLLYCRIRCSSLAEITAGKQVELIIASLSMSIDHQMCNAIKSRGLVADCSSRHPKRSVCKSGEDQTNK